MKRDEFDQSTEALEARTALENLKRRSPADWKQIVERLASELDDEDDEASWLLATSEVLEREDAPGLLEEPK